MQTLEKFGLKYMATAAWEDLQPKLLAIIADSHGAAEADGKKIHTLHEHAVRKLNDQLLSPLMRELAQCAHAHMRTVLAPPAPRLNRAPRARVLFRRPCTCLSTTRRPRGRPTCPRKHAHHAGSSIAAIAGTVCGV